MKIIHTFTWRMFHTSSAYGETIEVARAEILANRPAWIPEGTELRYSHSVGRLDSSDEECVDCDGVGKYPAGHECESCGGSGRVIAGSSKEWPHV